MLKLNYKLLPLNIIKNIGIVSKQQQKQTIINRSPFSFLSAITYNHPNHHRTNATIYNNHISKRGFFNNNNYNNNNNINKNNTNRNFVNKNHHNRSIKSTTFEDIIKNENLKIFNKDYQDYFDLMKKNIGMKMFLKNVYITSALGFTGTILSGLVFSQMVPPTLAPLLIGGVGSILSILYYNSKQPTYEIVEMIWEDRSGMNGKTELNTKEKAIVKEFKTTIVPITIANYQPSQILSFIVLSLSNGLMISGVVGMLPLVTILNVAFMSIMVTSGSAICALKMKPESLSVYKPVLYGGLFGLLGIGILSIGSSLIFGPNTFTQIASSIDLYVGLGLFTALTAFDTQNGLKLFKEGTPDYLKVSIDIMLNTLNIFLRLLRFKMNDRDN